MEAVRRRQGKNHLRTLERRGKSRRCVFFKLDEEAEFFAIALCNMICFYSPQIIAIGGGVSLIGDPLIDRIRKYTEQYVYLNSKGTYQIVKSSLDEDVVLVGTLLLTAAK